MGVSIVLSGAIVMFAMIFIIGNIPMMTSSIFAVSQGSKDIDDVENEIIATKLDITSLNGSDNSDQITLALENIGQEKLWKYEKFDFIVTYDADKGGNKERVTEVHSYSEDCSTKKWCITSISKDNFDKDILNPNEVANIETILNNPVFTNGSVNVVISSQNGQKSSRSVQV